MHRVHMQEGSDIVMVTELLRRSRVSADSSWLVCSQAVTAEEADRGL